MTRVSINSTPPPPMGVKVFIDGVEAKFVVSADDVEGWAEVWDPSWPYAPVRRFGVVRIEFPDADASTDEAPGVDPMEAVRAMCR